MLLIIDKRLPLPAKNKLAEYGSIIEFETNGITYDAVSGHPDIFFCEVLGGLVVAPNTPKYYLSLLAENGIQFLVGSNEVKHKYPGTAAYNAVVTGSAIIHKASLTDPAILTLLKSVPADREVHFIDVNQGYTRCNLLKLRDDQFLTSNKGIEKALRDHGYIVLYVSPAEILLPGFSNGFFGGCCGVWNETLFVAGKLSMFPEGEKVRQFVQNTGIRIVELYDGPLFDGGGILFLE
jgi:hypothetical protein